MTAPAATPIRPQRPGTLVVVPILLVGALLWTSCHSLKEAQIPPGSVYRVWPEAPAEPRLAYTLSFRTPKEAGLRWTGVSWLSRWLLGEKQGDLVRPLGLGVDESNNLCIADSGNSAVSFLDFSRRTWQSWNKVGPIELVQPVAVAKRGGVFYVADAGLAKVLAFDAKGKLLFEAKEGIERPAGLVIVDNKLFVADAAAHKIVTLDLTGRFLFAFGARGTGPGRFNFPTHLAADATGRLLVTDSMNFRVQIFDVQGHYQKEFGHAGDGSGNLSRPKGVGVDRHGNVYLVDALFDNVQIFSEAGDFLLAFGERGAGPGEFWLPTGIAVTADDRVFVADSYNRRVQVFRLLPHP